MCCRLFAMTRVLESQPYSTDRTVLVVWGDVRKQRHTFMHNTVCRPVATGYSNMYTYHSENNDIYEKEIQQKIISWNKSRDMLSIFKIANITILNTAKKLRRRNAATLHNNCLCVNHSWKWNCLVKSLMLLSRWLWKDFVNVICMVYFYVCQFSKYRSGKTRPSILVE